MTSQQKPTLNSTASGSQTKHWSQLSERGTYLGIVFLLKINQWFGRWLFRIFIWPIVAYFFITGKAARQASMDYLNRLYQHSLNQHTTNPNSSTNNKGPDNSSPRPFSKKPGYWQSFKHFISFAESALDKIDAWSGKLTHDDIHYQNYDIYQQLEQQKQGAVFIGSHLGNLEVCRALNKHNKVRVNVMVFTQHAAQFNRILKKIDPQVDIDLIQVTNVGADLAIMLKQRIDDGEHVVIAADRTSANSFGRTTKIPFLGKPASISQGPFVLASLMDCPVYMMFCFKAQNGYDMMFEPFDLPFKCSRKQRNQRLEQQMRQYVARITFYCLRYPQQWYNFFDFWLDDAQVKRAADENLKER